MKFSACCITQSRFRVLHLVAGVLLLWEFFVGPVLKAQDASSASTPSKAMDDSPTASSAETVVDANALQKDGKRPFHLKLSFQVYELNGKPGEKGTLDYWWAGPAGNHLDVTSPSLGTVHSLRTDTLPDTTARRSAFLAGELLNDYQSPGSILGVPRNQVENEEHVTGTTILECMHPVLPPGRSSAANALQVCTDSISGTIRLIESQQYRIVRNHPAMFAGTHVALDTSIAWGGVQAIAGHVEDLRSFDPNKTEVALQTPVPANAITSSLHSVVIGSGVMAGSKIGGGVPRYPDAARARRIQGTVVMEAQIMEDGHIAFLIPMSSPDPLLTEAAMDAVSTWRYKPFLLNGNPVNVTTTVTVHFNLN